VKLINTELQNLFKNLEGVFKIIGVSRKKISDNCDNLKPGELRELQYALKATSVNDLVYGGDVYDQYTSDNDYRSSKRGIEKLNLSDLEKYRRKKELEQDDMSVEAFRTGRSRNSLYKKAVQETDYRRSHPYG
jgi:hypothetical protein